MRNGFFAIAIILAATLITSTAQILYKLGVNKAGSGFGVLNLYLISGILLYAIAAAIVLFAFRIGQVSVLYPLFATSYIWVSLLSSYFFNESVGAIKLLGISLIIAGVAFIGIDAGSIKKPEMV